MKAAELLELFHWLTEAQSGSLSERELAAVQEELAEGFLYVLPLANRLGNGLVEAAHRKMAVIAERCPVSQRLLGGPHPHAAMNREA